MTDSVKTREEWKAEGDSLCETKEYYKAILYYDQALQRTNSEGDAIVLLLSRCHARIHSEHLDSALEDAQAVLHLSPNNEDALFCVAKALYGLRRFKESADRLAEMIKLFPKNQEAIRDLQRCLTRLREEAGLYDFAAMLDEASAKYPASKLDRADYFGPIEVRNCAIESHGRGVFSTKQIRAGDLLLVEKAFHSTVSEKEQSPRKDGVTTGLSGEEEMSELCFRVAAGILFKLHRNPSLAPAFADLYPGPDANEELGEDGRPVIDDLLVSRRMNYNAFAFSTSSKVFQWRFAQQISSSEQPADENSTGVGVWLKASYVNHSCYPSVRRSFIGDMMIWRAKADIPPNTELKFSYISIIPDYAGRQKELAKYCFVCECNLCLSEKDTPPKKMKERDTVTLKIVKCLRGSTPTDMKVYYELLEKLQQTYIFPVSQDPRRYLIVPVVYLIAACRAQDKQPDVVRLGMILLQGLGFETEITFSSWRIKKWGLLTEDVGPVLVDLLEVFEPVNLPIGEGLREDLKIAYTIMSGEVVTFDEGHKEERLRQLTDSSKQNGPGNTDVLEEETMEGLGEMVATLRTRLNVRYRDVK